MLFGSYSDDEVGSNAGQVYLVFGKATGWGPSTSLAYADASFLGENPGDFAGSHVSPGGDINGDGFQDLLIAASFYSYIYPDIGKAYFVFGWGAGWAMDTPLSSANGMMWGESADDVFGQVSGGGDVNGDGYDDVVVGSMWNDENATRAGQTYLYLGGSWDEDLDGWMVNEGDCDDSDAIVFPGALELCDGLDNDCDGIVDDDNCDGKDSDSDGTTSADEQDADADGWLPCEGDCDDGDFAIHPEAEELCDGVDNDCNGDVDEVCLQDDDDSIPHLDDDADEPTDCQCRLRSPGALKPRKAAILSLLVVAQAMRRRSRQTLQRD